MADRRRGPQPLSSILPDALRQVGLDERLEERAPLLRWAEIAGQEIGRHTRAVDLQDGELVLEADHGAWRQEVTMLAPAIIEKFNAIFGAGTVTALRWRERSARQRRPGRNS